MLYAPRGVVVRRIFPGVPGSPDGWRMAEYRAARLTNPWAYVFGPFYFLCRGLWRKALTLMLLCLCLMLVPQSAEELALERLLCDHYASVLMYVLAGPMSGASDFRLMIWGSLPFAALELGVVFALAGRRIAACLLLPLAFTVFAFWKVVVPGLDLGIAPSFNWIMAREIWPLVAGVCGYAALAGRARLLGGGLVLGAALYGLGLPVHGLSLKPALLTFVYLTQGFMAELDLYRHRVLRLRFWW